MGTFYTIALTLFFAIDAFGLIPEYLSCLVDLDPKKRQWVALRELLCALAIMALFHFVGPFILGLLDLTATTTKIAGGMVLFLIAIQLVFPKDEETQTRKWAVGNHFIVPIATPLIAGPSVLAIIMIYSLENHGSATVLLSILTAWFFSALIFFFAIPIYELVGNKVLVAVQRLMGLVIALIAVQMFLQGIKQLL